MSKVRQLATAYRSRLIAVLFFVGSLLIYLVLNQIIWALEPTFSLVQSRLDQATPFVPPMIFVYFSWYFQLIIGGLGILLLPKGALNDRWNRRLFYTAGGALLFCCLVFMVYPTQVPRPDVSALPGLSGAVLRFIYGADHPINCLPSCHVVGALHMAYFSIACHGRRHRVLAWGMAAWAILISFSTVLVKQHAWADVGVAVLLSLLTCGYDAYRYGRKPSF